MARDRGPRQSRRADRDAPRRSRKEKGKDVAGASSTAHEEDEVPTEITTAPWPRNDGEPFLHGLPILEGRNITLTSLKRDTRYRERLPHEPWGVSNSIFYNGWLRITLRPTRVVCGQTLRAMGILQEVTTMLKRMGLGSLPFKSYPLYPELTRQFLASVELHMRDGANGNAQEAFITYFSRGILYELTIPELCRLYGFNHTRTSCVYPENFARPIWPVIANTSQVSRECKLSLIRNPVIRVAAKILGSVFLGKEEAGAVSAAELILIHFGLPRSIDTLYGFAQSALPAELETNLGFKFAEMLVEKRARGINIAKTKDEFIGNLLTPIFQHSGIDLRSETVNDKTGLFDERYFKYAHILKGNSNTYEFTSRDGVVRYTKLPVPNLTAPTNLPSMLFEIPENLYCPPPHTASRRRHAPQEAEEDQPEPQDGPQEFALPAYQGQFDLEPLPAGATMEERMNRILENQEKQTSMMRCIWGGLSKISCFGGGQSRARREGATTSGAGTSGAAAARQEPEDEDDEETEEDEELTRRPRARREPGQSRSVSPDF